MIAVDERPAPAEFDSAEEPRRAVPKIFVGGPGLALRNWEYDEWRRLYGEFGSVRSHGWHAWDRTPEVEAREYCQATIITADLRCDCDCKWNRDENCMCVGDLVYRGVCTWCDWEAELFWDDENLAVEDALDHAWPGWRELPVVDSPPEDGRSKSAKARMERWRASLTQYPEGWIEQGGPIKTWRKYGSHRHVPGRIGGGGYDLGIPIPGTQEEWEVMRQRIREKQLTEQRGSTE